MSAESSFQIIFDKNSWIKYCKISKKIKDESKEKQKLQRNIINQLEEKAINAFSDYLNANENYHKAFDNYLKNPLSIVHRYRVTFEMKSREIAFKCYKSLDDQLASLKKT